jgi:hypothetical protein
MCIHYGGFWAKNDKQGALLSLTRLHSIKTVTSKALLNAWARSHSWKRHVPVSAQSSSTDSFGISFGSEGRIMVMTAPP